MSPEWQAIHIFYTADSSPLLTDCVAPLVQRLRERGLLGQYFFINYWLEGPHVRLRLKPSSQAAVAEVTRTAQEAIATFLARRPALFETDSEFLLEFYEEMFRLEYTEEERIERFGGTGRMPLRDNNSYHALPYEPEYDKYGGEAGVELAEWHFEHSSDLVLDLVGTANVHVRTVRLGLAAQVMMIMSTVFLRDRETLADFMGRYHGYWREAFQTVDLGQDTRYQTNYESMADDLQSRFGDIRDAIGADRIDELTGFSGHWVRHCTELRARVVALSEAGRLVFPTAYRGDERAPVTDPDVALGMLLSPYMHMTNNRLGATITDEAYLSFLLERALRAGLSPATG